MTEALASRVAGLKLGGIVGILLLPMLVLSYFMISALRTDMQFAGRELVGIELTRLVMPVAFGAASHQQGEAEADIAGLRQMAKPQVEELGLGQQFSTVLAALITHGKDERYAIDSLERLQRGIATSSFVILDPFAETYFLGSVSVEHSAAQLADFTHLWTLKNRAIRDGVITPDEAAKLLLATGAWQESQKRLVESLKSARDASRTPEDYNEPLSIAEEAIVHPLHVSKILSQPVEVIARQLDQTEKFQADAVHIIEDIRKLWAFSAKRFQTLIKERLSSLWLRLLMFLGIAAAACLIGVGGAALMFGSTLKQLDDVKQMRDLAEHSRAAALQSATEVQRINEDVGRLNADLARNLAMLREAQDDNLRKGKMAQLGQLTATVAHELRNPLGAVRTSAFLLARKVKDKGLGIEPQIERINSGITRCDNIISQLLDFARSKAIQPEQVDFDDWLARLIEEEAGRLPVALSIECHLGIGGHAAIDPARMSRAVINLLSNAAEALAGKGDETAKPLVPNPTITVTSRIAARGFEVTVADNGPGIGPEHLDKIFEPLFTTKNFGTGLGLPAVRKIMEQHGGGLEVASTPGQGAAFTLWWPNQMQMKEAS